MHKAGRIFMFSFYILFFFPKEGQAFLDSSSILWFVVSQLSASVVLEDSEALFADMAQRLEKTKAEVSGNSISFNVFHSQFGPEVSIFRGS